MKKDARATVDYSTEIPEWIGVARALGWQMHDLRAIQRYKEMPSAGNRSVTNVFEIERTRIRTATRAPDGRWGIASWPRSIEVTVGRYTRPEGHDYCFVHRKDTPHDDAGECQVCLDARNVKQRLADADILHLISEPCTCVNGWLGEHHPDCEIYLQERDEALDLVLSEKTTEHELQAPHVPQTPAPKKVEKLSKKELARMPLPGQTKLFG